MKNDELTKYLVDFGLSEKESQVYVALLELEVASVAEIARRTRINRSSMYVVLDSLKKKGLVASTEDSSIQKFVASSPNVLYRKANQDVKNKSVIFEKISEILPELKGLHKDTKQKPKVLIHEGHKGIKNVLKDSVKSKEKMIKVFSSIDNFLIDIMPDYFPVEYVKERIAVGTRMEAIHFLPDDSLMENFKEFGRRFPKGFDRHITAIDDGNYNYANLVVYDDKVIYISPEDDGLAIVIESAGIANTMKLIFSLSLKEVQKNAVQDTGELSDTY